MGIAAEYQPYTVPHCIARRIYDVDPSKLSQIENWTREDPSIPLKISTIGDISNMIDKRHPPPQDFPQYTKYNESNAVKQMSVNDATIRSFEARLLTDEDAEVLVGEDAFRVLPNESFQIYFPFRFGYINKSTSRSLESTISDISTIWEHVLTKKLQIVNFKDYKAMLVIPDMFQQGDIKILGDILLNYFHFSSLFIHKDSVCASVGIGKQISCVVNIGHTKTTVSCIDEGDIIPGTSFHMNYGGDNITELFYHLLINQGELATEQQLRISPEKEAIISEKIDINENPPETEALIDNIESDHDTHYYPPNFGNLDWIRDYDIFQKMKETCCQFVPKNQILTYAFHLFSSIPPTGRPRVNGSLISINISPKIPVIAAFGLFQPDILNIFPFYSAPRHPSPKRKRYPCANIIQQFETSDLLWVNKDGYPKETPNLCPHDDVHSVIVERIREISDEYSAPKKKKKTSSKQKTTQTKRRRKSKLASSISDEQEKFWEQLHTEQGCLEFAENCPFRLKLSPWDLDRRSIVPIHQAIVESISQVDDKSLRSKLFENIVLTGGCSRLHGLNEILEEKILSILPRETEKINIVSNQELEKEDPQTTYTWHGAQIILKHLQTKDMISKTDAQTLREKLFFCFDNNENDIFTSPQT